MAPSVQGTEDVVKGRRVSVGHATSFRGPHAAHRRFRSLRIDVHSGPPSPARQCAAIIPIISPLLRKGRPGGIGASPDAPRRASRCDGALPVDRAPHPHRLCFAPALPTLKRIPLQNPKKAKQGPPARPCPFCRGIPRPEPERRRQKILDARTGTLYEQTRFLGGLGRQWGFGWKGRCAKKHGVQNSLFSHGVAREHRRRGGGAERKGRPSRRIMTEHDIS